MPKHSERKRGLRQRREQRAQQIYEEEELPNLFLAVFTAEWNLAHQDLQFAASLGVPRGPAEIMVRFDPHRNQRSVVSEWGSLNQQLLMKSEQTLLISSDPRQFSHGILNIDVACASERFSERTAIKALRWLGEEFFLGWLWQPEQK